ncbi:copper resistance CopC/CopD family protein [Rhizobium leguminosarum]|uniref:copper resistance CopC/CopD family protein n=1 Tax=Rhizobium leguminosarum TaxID=384 RepID=UPI0014417A04|nr:CopD family protein [Rhizobium leguminosarum]MBY5867765.1 copper resistance protein CopC/CopD [Rhizobium leguminosarum]NKM04741.1 copper-binding protein [Rhizobium leguminosarum bv. viciae]
MSTIARAWAAFAQAAALLLIASALFFPSDIHAHALLTGSSPSSGQVFKASPTDVQLHFNEPVRVVRATVSLPDGESQDLGSWGAGGDVTIGPLPSVDDGTIIVSYRVVSEDGHPVGGTVVFHVGSTSVSAAAMGAEADAASFRLLAAAIWLTHIVSVLLVAFVVGGRFFVAVFDRGRPYLGRPSVALMAAAIVTFAAIYLQGLDEIGAGLSFAGLAPLKAGLASRSGASAILSLFAIVIAASPFTASGKPGLAAAASAMVLASTAFTFTGHCNVAAPRWLAQTCIFLHGGVLLFWIGSLLPLWRLSSPSTGRRALRSFSKAIPIPFLAMLAAGAVLAWIELPSIQSVLSSTYGRVLLLKIGLVSVLCVLAAYNRFWLTAPATRGDATARSRLRASICAEIAVAVAIVGVASLWRFAGPEQVPYLEPEPLGVHLHSESAMAQLELKPQADGHAEVRVTVLTPEFDAMEPKAIELRLTNPKEGVEAIKYDLMETDDGTWSAQVLPIERSPAGWKVDLKILIDDFTATHVEGELSEAVTSSGRNSQAHRLGRSPPP